MTATQKAQSAKRGAWLSAMSAISLAFTDIAAPVVYEAGSNPPTVLMLRALVTMIVIATLLIITGRMKILTPMNEINCVVSGLMFMLAGYGLLSAFAILPVSTVVLLLYLFPIFTSLLDAIARRRFPNFATIILLFIALVGLFLALEISGSKFNGEGIYFGVLAAISVAATMVWNNHKLENIDPEQITFRMFCVSFVVFLIWVIAGDSFAIPQTPSGNLTFAAMLACFSFAFLAMFRGAQMAGSVRAAMIMNLEPVIAIVLAVIFLHESMKPIQMIGAAIVLAAVMLAQLRKSS